MIYGPSWGERGVGCSTHTVTAEGLRSAGLKGQGSNLHLRSFSEANTHTRSQDTRGGAVETIRGLPLSLSREAQPP
jgi:hypothetical protein